MDRYIAANCPTSASKLQAWRGLDNEKLFSKTLRSQLRGRHSNAGEVFVHEGDKGSFILLVLEGWIALTKSLSDGETQIVDLLMPGDLAQLGAPGAMTLPYSAEALSDVHYTTLTEEMISGPEPEAASLRRALLTTMAMRQSRGAELLLRLGHGSAETRVCYAIAELYLRLQAIGKTEKNVFQIPMTQKQLGQFTGLSNVHVCRTLRRLGRQGLIRSCGTSMEILDINAISHIADIDLDDLRAGIVP